MSYPVTRDDKVRLVAACAASAALGAAITFSYFRSQETKRRSEKEAAALNTESRRIYETQDSARQYMEFHFTPSKVSFCRKLNDISEAYDFPLRVARKFDTFKPTNPTGRALDLGCATGASVFEMSKYFREVIGVDLSNAFIDCANELKTKGRVDYFAPDQGKTVVERSTGIPVGTFAERCTFLVGDALNVDPALGAFDGVLAANLLCRVPDPRKLLDSFAKLVVSGGVLVIVSPYSWWEGATAIETWIGGRPGEPRSEDQCKAILSENFVLLDERDEPFLIRDHHRRFQLGFSHCTVWRRK